MIFFYFCRGRARTYTDKQFRRGGIIKCRALWENFETSLIALCVSHLISLTYVRTMQFLREANAFFCSARSAEQNVCVRLRGSAANAFPSDIF
jgi:hypothetical protein